MTKLFTVIMSFERVVVKFLLEVEHPFQMNLVCSVKMFRIYIRTASATLSLIPST